MNAFNKTNLDVIKFFDTSDLSGSTFSLEQMKSLKMPQQLVFVSEILQYRKYSIEHIPISNFQSVW